MNAIEVLEAAKKKLLDGGWQRNHWGEEGGPYCSEGALIWVQYDHRNSHRNSRLTVQAKVEATRFLLDAIERRTGQRLSVISWNDRTAIGPSDVIAVFDDAILAAKEATA